MGQRHQIVVIYPKKSLNEGNVNNRPERAEVIHHQWLYGRSAILALDRILRLAANSWDGTGTDYLFGRGDTGYTSGDGTRAIAAAVSVCPDEGYFHRVHLWEDDTKDAPTAPQDLTPSMFDNNDGITVIRFKTGENLPGYAFITPSHLEGSHWKDRDGLGPWNAEQYLAFYYSRAEQCAWPADLQLAMEQAFQRISRNARLMDRAELKALFPKFKLTPARKPSMEVVS